MLHGGAKIWILFSSGKKIFYERAQRVSKILFHNFKPPCNVLVIIIIDKKTDKIMEGNDQNYVIDKLTYEIMENKQLRSWM